MRIATLRRHLNDALSEDPRVALVAVRQMIEEDIPWLERRAVRQARWYGYSWARIGRLLSRARQSVRERFAELDEQPLIFPADELDELQRAIARGPERRADERRRAELEAWDREGGIVPW